MVFGVIIAGALIVPMMKLWSIVPVLLTLHGTNAGFAKVTLLPTVALFSIFVCYIVWQLGRSLWRGIADRHLPLLTITEAGVTLYGIKAITLVPWNELTAVRVERFRSARFLKLDVRGSGLPGGKNTKALGLQPLDGTADVVVEAIRHYPAYRGA